MNKEKVEKIEPVWPNERTVSYADCGRQNNEVIPEDQTTEDGLSVRDFVDDFDE